MRFVCFFLILISFSLQAQVVSLPEIIKAEPFEFFAFGDMPYRLEMDSTRIDRLIQYLNAKNPAFSVHVGDFKSGRMLCSDEYFASVAKLFNNFTHPLVYTPGDNEWTDCHRESNGSYDPQERLNALRKVFFKNGKSLGQKKMTVETQGSYPQYATFVENLRWSHGNVLFVTLHVVGSNNNLGSPSKYYAKSLKEFATRHEANIFWLKEAFTIAKQKKYAGVVVLMQADPGFELKGDYKTGFTDLEKAFESLALEFIRPVLLVHGDSHYYRVDKPFLLSEGETKRQKYVYNFTRAEVFGSPHIQALQIKVNPANPELFEIYPTTLIENMVLEAPKN